MKFNDDQLRAIEVLDKNVSVSAGAGSGKTRVLVERFCRIVGEGQATPDRILTVTFTEKAAKEMKERIVGRFAERFRETGDDRFEAAARAVETAYIGTIHGFASRVLRENAFEAGVDPQFKTLTEIETEVLKERVIDTLIAGGFVGGKPEYIDLALVLGRTNVAPAIKSLYSELTSLGRDAREVAPARVTARQLESVAAAYDDLALDILQYDGKISPKMAERLEEYQEFYPLLREAMAQMMADFKEHTGAEAVARFDWDRYRVIERATKQFPGGIGRGEFQDTLAGPAKQAAAVFAAMTVAPLGAYYSECLIKITTDFHEAYTRAKRRSGHLDFDDLLLAARGLLVGKMGEPTATAADYSRYFKFIMMDEFQDTNEMQKSIIESVTPSDRFFTVGDVKQSIFSFMHSDVAVFQGHHQAARQSGGVTIPMTQNYRSRQEVIDFVNLFFKEIWREDDDFEFEALGAEGDFHAGGPGEMELLWVEKSRRGGDKEKQPLSGVERERAAEARAMAHRIRELLGQDGHPPLMVTKKSEDGDEPRPLTPGDIIILFRSTGDIKVYERALADAGIDYYVVSGRGFYAAREVQDILNLLRVVENPLDDVAMAAVLRSPMVAITDDALWWLSRDHRSLPGHTVADGEKGDVPPPTSTTGKLYFSLGRLESIDQLAADDRTRLEAFWAVLRELQGIRSESRLTRLIDRAVKLTAYDLKLLASERGKRQFANLRKLSEAARQFGAASVFQLPDFIRHVERMKVVAEREGEAPTESQESDVVRLMTIHKAKGLQAPVVFVAGCSRQLMSGRTRGSFRFDKEMGLTAKVKDPQTGKSLKLAPRPFDLASARAKERDIAEEKRLFYVAATRAQELLILSGAPAFDGKPGAEERYDGVGSWMGWLEKALALDAPPDTQDEVVDNDGLRMRLRAGVTTAPVAVEAGAQSYAQTNMEQLLAAEPLPVTPGPDLADMTPPASIGAKRPVNLTVSRVVDYLACPRKYQVRWQLAIEEEPAGQADTGAEMPADAPAAPDAAAVGTAVHEVLASVDWAGDPGQQIERLAALQDVRVRQDVRAACARFLESPWPARIKAGSDWFAEAPFSVEFANCRLYGRIDLLFRDERGWVVVDYKTGSGTDQAGYAQQVLLYALALEKSIGELPVEVALVAVGKSRDYVQEVNRALLDQTESTLLDVAAGIKTAAFTRAPDDHCYRCGYYNLFCSVRADDVAGERLPK